MNNGIILPHQVHPDFFYSSVYCRVDDGIRIGHVRSGIAGGKSQ